MYDLNVMVELWRPENEKAAKEITLEDRLMAACQAFVNPPQKRTYVPLMRVVGTLRNGCAWEALGDDRIFLGDGHSLVRWVWNPTIDS